MTRIGLLAALALAAMAADAQPQRADIPAPSPAAESHAEPSGELAARPAPRLNQAAARPLSDVDARHCLELATNSQVHRCAEPFRTRSSQSRGKP